MSSIDGSMPLSVNLFGRLSEVWVSTSLLSSVNIEFGTMSDSSTDDLEIAGDSSSWLCSSFLQ